MNNQSVHGRKVSLMERNPGRKGPRMPGPMQEAFSKLSVIVVKDSAKTGPSDEVIGRDPALIKHRRHEDILRDQMEYGRQLAAQDQDHHEEPHMEQTEKQGRVHRVNPQVPSPETKPEMVSSRRRVWEFMKAKTELGQVMSATEIGDALESEGYNKATVVAEVSKQAKANILYVPEGFQSAKPQKFMLNLESPEPPVNPYIRHNRLTPSSTKESVDVTKQVQNTPLQPLPPVHPEVKHEEKPMQLETTPAVSQPVHSTIADTPETTVQSLKKSLQGAMSLDNKQLSEAILESLNVKQTLELYESIKQLLGK